MTNNDAHNQWENEYNNAKRYFDKFDKILGIVYDQLKKKKSEREQFLKRSGEWKDKPLEEVFIDDFVFDEKGKPIKNLFASLKGVYDTIKQEDIDKLPEEQRRIAQKRFKELHELVDRGQRMIASGYTKEYTDKVLRLTYDMSKDGLREVAAEIDLTGLEKSNLFPKDFVTVFDPDFKKKKSSVISEQGWFNSDNGITKQLGNKTFGSLTEYIASKTTPEAFNTIESANAWHGVGSYSEPACYRKYAVLKSMGYGPENYSSWADAKQTLSNEGSFVNDRGENMKRIFRELKKAPADLDNYSEGQTVFDAAIQLLLENATIPGVDKDTRTMILIRTEDKYVVPNAPKEDINGMEINGQPFHPGVCESYGHITASRISADSTTLTATRVPYSRVHSLWFMERGEIDSSGGYSKMPFRLFGQNDDGDFQFWAYHQNEVNACAQNLPVIHAGDLADAKETYKIAKKILLEWERDNKNGKN